MNEPSRVIRIVYTRYEVNSLSRKWNVLVNFWPWFETVRCNRGKETVVYCHQAVLFISYF